MKLINHVLKIRSLVQRSIDNRFSRIGLKENGIQPADTLPDSLKDKRQKLEDILKNHLDELGEYAKARQETINECTFTLFNRIAAIKVMEDKELFPEVIRRRPENGNRSFAHNLWLEEHPEEKNAERQGLKHFLQDKFNELGEKFPLYAENYPYAMMPMADELYNILEAFNEVESDADCGADIWKGDDILGWLYENFNATEKEVLKASGEKTEYDKVSLQSQVYTPQWVVKFLVDNTLGKMYLEMFPDSSIVKPDDEGVIKYRIANAPKTRTRESKKMEEIRVIDPACGSGNFLIYTFTLLYDMYINQIEQYGAEYSKRDIPKLIIENNIYGVDLDERAVQLSQIALYIKAREVGGRRAQVPAHTNVVSTHFFLPNYDDVASAFEGGGEWDSKQKEVIRKIWTDLQNAYKFGTLVRVEEVLNQLTRDDDSSTLFAEQEADNLFSFKHRVTDILRDQVKEYCVRYSSEYALTKANDAMTFLSILSTPFDAVVANPPYTDSSDFGEELHLFVDNNYKRGLKFNSNLYACFIKRSCELAGNAGKVGMVNPPSFMYIKSFEDVRKYIVEHTHINLFVEWGYLGMFSPSARVDSAMYVLEKDTTTEIASFIKLNDLYEMRRKAVFDSAYIDLCSNIPNERVFNIKQPILKKIKGYPFIYWISDDFRQKFEGNDLNSVMDIKQGIATADNNRFLRFWWEVLPSTISESPEDGKKWIKYSKGGPYNKWYGNLWTIINWANDGYEIKHFADVNGKIKSAVRNSEYYFRDAITYTSSGSKGATFRYLPENYLFDSGGSCIFSNKYSNLYYVMAFLNSKLSFYICDCLNPTVNTTQGDLWRIPFVNPNYSQESLASRLAKQNVDIKVSMCKHSLIETNFEYSPFLPGHEPLNCIHSFFSEENLLNTLILINEAVINNVIFSVYQLSPDDKDQVLKKEGRPLTELPVSPIALEVFKKRVCQICDFRLDPAAQEYLDSIEASPSVGCSLSFDALYQANNEWEDFCSRQSINPIEAWYQFDISKSDPKSRVQSLAFELIADTVRTVLEKDDDGVIPLVDKMGEERLSMRIEQELSERGYSNGEITIIEQLLGMPLDDYLKGQFFRQLTEHLNLFQYLPKTPFIWHITSGPKHALEVYVSIYKWSRNTLFNLKSIYSANVETSLKDRLSTLSSDDAFQQMEANDIREKLNEIRNFIVKIDSLLSSDYKPSIDDGVAKNIAPLQKMGLLSYDVLNPGQLKKYLNAEW
jgi:hypothetical protein